MKYLLLDTNIYLHYIDFEQIDWADIVDDKDFAILVPYTVIKEIDKHKDGPRGKIKNRAKAVSSKFGQYFLDDTNNIRKLNIVPIDDPSDEVLSANGLNRSVCDDAIIGSALASAHRPDIVVISHDNTLLIKAKKFGLTYLPKMPEKYLIAEEKSEEEKELDRCRKELMQYQNRQPKPSITFADGETTLRIRTSPVPDAEALLSGIMTDIRTKHPHIHKNSSQYNLTDGSMSIENLMRRNFSDMLYASYSDEQIEKHNKELDKYYAACEKYYRFKLERQQLDKQMHELRFTIVNSGSAETGEMNIFLTFPDHVALYNAQSKKYINDIKPEAPLPRTSFNEYGSSLSLMRNIIPGQGLNCPQIPCWDLMKPLPRHELTFKEESLIHNVQRTISGKGSIYVDTEQCGHFAIKWTICAAGCLIPVKGTLNVIIESVPHS